MKKRYMILSVTISAACLLATAVPALAANSFTIEDAKAAAAPYLPSGSTFLRSETDNQEYELRYYNEGLQELYDLEVSRTTQSVTKLESQKLDHQGAASVSLSAADVEALITGQYPTASNVSVWLDEDDGYYVYEAALTADSSQITLKFHPQTGVILEKDIDYDYTSPDSAARATSGILRSEEARTLALKQVPGAVLTDIGLDEESGTPVYEIGLYKDGCEYSLILNAQTGEKIYLSSHRDLRDDSYCFQWDHHNTTYYGRGCHHGRHH